jgi:hypothetical protein
VALTVAAGSGLLLGQADALGAGDASAVRGGCRLGVIRCGFARVLGPWNVSRLQAWHAQAAPGVFKNLPPALTAPPAACSPSFAIYIPQHAVHGGARNALAAAGPGPGPGPVLPTENKDARSRGGHAGLLRAAGGCLCLLGAGDAAQIDTGGPCARANATPRSSRHSCNIRARGWWPQSTARSSSRQHNPTPRQPSPEPRRPFRTALIRCSVAAPRAAG